MTESEDDLIASEGWMVTYLDTFTLLLGFFVILTGLGDYKFFTIYDESSKGGTWVNTDLMALHSDLQQRYLSELDSSVVDVSLEDYEIRLSFHGNTFFQSGSAELIPGSKEIIDRSLSVFKEIGPDRFFVDVEGHTDSRPIQSSAYLSNWELSSARAANIVRYFLDEGYDPKRLKASGYADTYLLVPDYDDKGIAIEANNAINRRIVFRIYVKRPDGTP
jgi:chemotaxis protein MotB